MQIFIQKVDVGITKDGMHSNFPSELGDCSKHSTIKGRVVEGMLCVGFQPPRGVDNTDACLSLTVPRGKRQWKCFYAHLKGFLLYFARVSVSILLEN